ncbi:hypothetical protein TNCT_344161 [Trichonephila clavata]|uniref:Uncharacterized protein n=1 Tax=Trichonephila clavata TaxID=2740835 RepID=A0A8X6F834_TRICU|nr:hypothetical protein TNCT_344161 [Trichonephila clavata]
MNVITMLSFCTLAYGDFHLYLDEKIGKRQMPSAQIRANAYETVEKRYPSSLWTHVYTDGTKIERGTGASAGVAAILHSIRLREKILPILLVKLRLYLLL